MRTLAAAGFFESLSFGALAADLGLNVAEVNKTYNAVARKLDIPTRISPLTLCGDAIIGAMQGFAASQTKSCIYQFESIEFEAIATPGSDKVVVIQARMPNGGTRQNAEHMTLFTVFTLSVFGDFPSNKTRGDFFSAALEELQDNGVVIKTSGKVQFTMGKADGMNFSVSVEPKP